MNLRRTIGTLAAAAALGTAGTARAQETEPAFAPELSYGLGVGAGVLANAGELEVCATAADGTGSCQALAEAGGGGAAVFIGARPWPWLALLATYDVAFHQVVDGSPYAVATLQSLRADVRFLFAAGATVEPYLQAGAGLYLIGDSYGFAQAGGGFQAGGGLDVYLAPVLSFGLEALYRGIYFSAFGIARDDLPGAAGDGDVARTFLHDVSLLLNLTVHSVL
jgi:hypothetical protein